MKTIMINGEPFKTKAGRVTHEMIAFFCGFDPEASGIQITYRAKVQINLPGETKTEAGKYEGILSKGRDCVVFDKMVFNVGQF